MTAVLGGVHSGIAASWWYQQKQQFGITITSFSLVSVLGLIVSWEDLAFAQIIPDTTLGNENSRVTSTGTVDRISGGATLKVGKCLSEMARKSR
jgi:hypothetical protein